MYLRASSSCGSRQRLWWQGRGGRAIDSHYLPKMHSGGRSSGLAEEFQATPSAQDRLLGTEDDFRGNRSLT
jgi:hypothetical protein